MRFTAGVGCKVHFAAIQIATKIVFQFRDRLGGDARATTGLSVPPPAGNVLYPPFSVNSKTLR